MKCPYKTKVIHKSETLEDYAQDITEFCECCKGECPFYYTEKEYPHNEITEHCHKAESEVKK